MSTGEDVAKILLEVGAITLNSKNPYRYASGILSPVYTDCRLLLAYPKLRRKIRDLYLQAIKDSGVKVEVLAATATAGIPHAAWIADKLDLPMVYIRGKNKDHGKENLVEGLIKKGQEAIVIEDLISTGESSINSALAVRKSGGKVTNVFSIITYGMDLAKKNFQKNKLKFVSMTTFSDVVTQAQKLGKIDNKEKEAILEWAKDPPTWGKRMGLE